MLLHERQQETSEAHYHVLASVYFFPPSFLIGVHFGDESGPPGKPTSLAPVNVQTCLHMRERGMLAELFLINARHETFGCDVTDAI